MGHHSQTWRVGVLSSAPADKGALIVFRSLPGVERIECEKMIAEKFHHNLPREDVDDLSRAIFGITEADVRYLPPQWFQDGFDSREEWDAAPEIDDDESCDERWEFDLDAIDLESESPQRISVYLEANAFEQRMRIPDDLNDDYDLMDYARSFGFDFSDPTGKHPLRVTRLFFRQALAAARGVMGHLPDMSELRTRQWGENLAEEARKFRRQKG